MVFWRRPGRPRIRRPSRRPRAPAPRRVPPVVRQALMRAARAQERGDFAQAAHIYQQLADEALSRGLLRPGAYMELEAARAWLLGRKPLEARAPALHVLELALEAKRPPHAALRVLKQISVALSTQGAEQEAEALDEQVDRLLSEYHLRRESLEPEAESSQRTGQLPARCPSCYAPLHSDEVVWLEPGRAECPYCGSIILGS